MAHRAAARPAGGASWRSSDKNGTGRGEGRARFFFLRRTVRRAGIVATYWADTGSSEATILNFFTP